MSIVGTEFPIRTSREEAGVIVETCIRDEPEQVGELRVEVVELKAGMDD
jgi:hypothetical protein